MRKLTDAEVRFLEAIPKDFTLPSGRVLPGTLYPWLTPKHTNCCTVRNLWNLGLITLGNYRQVLLHLDVPGLAITDAGREALAKARAARDPDNMEIPDRRAACYGLTKTQVLLHLDVPGLWTDKEREVMRCYFWHGKTLETMGKRYKVTREYIRRIIRSAMIKLRAHEAEEAARREATGAP